MHNLQSPIPHGYQHICTCEDPAKCLKEMFVDRVQKKRYEKGQCPVRRPVFLRRHGIIKGKLEWEKDIPAAYKKGMFAKTDKKHDVYVRYSSDLRDGLPDWESTIGLGIKIFGMPGKKVLDGKTSDTADLLLQNVPFFFVDNARDFCGFTKASLEGKGDAWVQNYAPNTNNLLDAMQKPIRSVFGTEMWSVVPFKLGDNYCKYVVKPGTSTFFEDPDINDPDFLGKELAGRMAAGKATLDLYIQMRPTPGKLSATYIEENYPLDRLTVAWNEKEAVPVKVATIHLPKQDITKEQQEIYGEWLAFNIGRVPKENAPVGSIAEARMKVYQASADFRRTKNEQPTTEPTKPSEPTIKNPVCPFSGHRPVDKPKALTKDQIDRIVNVRIHPGIGVSRVGNSDKHYIGPEVKNPEKTPFGATRDDDGAIKREAARFRVYGYDKNGDVVAEIQQSDNSSIAWTVHVANKKASWYMFDMALDIPQAADVKTSLRNQDIGNRSELSIDPGPKTIMGINTNASSYRLNGEFMGTPVSLGELQTDGFGRLIFLPGRGKSASPSGRPPYDPDTPASFNNADRWYDDITDGPVHAKVTIGNREMDADSAWVISAPPNYAPDAVSWRTMNDLMRSVWMEAGMMPLPTEISFTRHIQPIFSRLTELQWVNQGFLGGFGVSSLHDFTDPTLLKKLSELPAGLGKYPDPNKEFRRTIYNSFRATNSPSEEKSAWPPIYGDGDILSKKPYNDKFLQLPAIYTYILEKWVAGSFIDDYTTAAASFQEFDQIPLQEQPNMLDEAAMHFCIADAFHPGAELTWPMRHASLYRAPYRIREAPAGKEEPAYGGALTQRNVMKINGPLFEQYPGSLTRWMALPWQGDTAYCRAGYEIEYDPYAPTYWAARVPNQVLSRTDYDVLCDETVDKDTRRSAFFNRSNWLRHIPKGLGAADVMTYMVNNFSKMGIVEALPRPKGKDWEWLPEMLYVENLQAISDEERDNLYHQTIEYLQSGGNRKSLIEAGWESAEQLQMFIDVIRKQ